MRQSVRGSRWRGAVSLTRRLARVRPTRLDAAAPPSVSWPPASHFTQLPRPPAATSHADARNSADGNRQPGRPPSPAPPEPGTRWHKLLAAVSSAVAISAVLICTVMLTGGPARRPGQSTASGRAPQTSDSPARLQPLRLTRARGGRAGYVVRDGVVYLTGFVAVHSRSGTEIAVLPPTVRPRTRLYFPVAATPAGTLAIQVSSSGVVRLLSNPAASHISRIWLSGVKFPVGS